MPQSSRDECFVSVSFWYDTIPLSFTVLYCSYLKINYNMSISNPMVTVTLCTAMIFYPVCLVVGFVGLVGGRWARPRQPAESTPLS